MLLDQLNAWDLIVFRTIGLQVSVVRGHMATGATPDMIETRLDQRSSGKAVLVHSWIVKDDSVLRNDCTPLA